MARVSVRPPAFIAALAVTGCLAAAPAGAVTYGSTLRAAPNAGFGCEAALVRGQGFNGPMLAPSGQRTCTYRSLGILGRSGGQSLAPSNGRITRIRVRAARVRGLNPAPLRLTVLTSSGSCCTARYLGPVFRPRADGRVTSVPVNVRVYRTVSDQRTQSNDVLGLSAVGPGTLPLHINPNAGTFATGNPVVTFWYPLTSPGQARTEGYTMDGIELLFQWDFRPA